MTTLFSKIKEVTELSAISGHEAPVRAYLREKLTPHVDEVVTDGLGGIFGVKHSEVENAPRVLVASHMDEVGFMVSEIKPDGTFRVVSIGGWNPMVVSSQRFKLFTREGREIPVISGSVPPHLTRGTGGPTMPAISDIVFDGGFADKAEAESFGIRPGDTIVPDVETIWTANKKRMISKCWDNRYGCTVVLEALKAVKDETLPNTLIAGANVQEEVGLRGTGPSVTKFNPDLFFAVDCSAADDISGSKETFGHLDQGFLLRILDPGMVTLPRMKEFLEDTALTHNIPFQYFVSQGGTDAGKAHLMNQGVPSAVIGVCARYIHTHQTMFSIKDYEAAREMVIQTIRALDRSTVNTILDGRTN